MLSQYTNFRHIKPFGWFRIYLYMYISGVFYDQSDDLVESIWGILAEFANKINVVSTQKLILISKMGSIQNLCCL